MSLQSRSYIFYLDHVRLSLEMFFNLRFVMESKFHQLLGPTFTFVKNTPQNATNLALRLILAAELGYIESLEVWLKQ